jgi:hypothetical protein
MPGEVISGTEVTDAPISALIAEQVRWCTWRIRRNSVGQGITEATAKYVWITPVGWKMLGVDLMKLQEQQLKKLRECEERQALIKEGLLGENEEISVLRARKRWYEQRSREALQYRRAKGAARKRANRLARMPRTVRSTK